MGSEREENMNSIKKRMLVLILPVIIIALLLLTCISLFTCESIASKQIKETMNATLESKTAQIGIDLNNVMTTATTLSKTVASTYKTADLKIYESMLGEIANSNNIILGSGIWFEPNVFDANEEYVGPYVYKD